MSPSGRRALTCALLLGFGWSLAVADEASAKDPRRLRLFRLEFDNDTYIGSDDGFTAGWGLQLHSRLMDRWGPKTKGWIGRLPGLGDDGTGGRIVRWAGGFGQTILTPSDIEVAEPQPDDVPWAGILAATATKTSGSRLDLI